VSTNLTLKFEELSLCVLLSTLARELAERIFAYVRGAVHEGRAVYPVSALLNFAGA
jgi:hypothetical protein